MNTGKAVAIFMQIDSDYTEDEKALAIHQVLKMPTYNSISKTSILRVTQYLWDKLYETGLEPEEVRKLKDSKLMEVVAANNLLNEELKRLKELEKQGLLIKLPCNEGDTIYVLEPNGNIQECKVYNITTNIYANNNKDNPYWKGFEIKDNLFGKTVFLTREEAEKALEATNE